MLVNPCLCLCDNLSTRCIVQVVLKFTEFHTFHMSYCIPTYCRRPDQGSVIEKKNASSPPSLPSYVACAPICQVLITTQTTKTILGRQPQGGRVEEDEGAGQA